MVTCTRKKLYCSSVLPVGYDLRAEEHLRDDLAQPSRFAGEYIQVSKALTLPSIWESGMNSNPFPRSRCQLIGTLRLASSSCNFQTRNLVLMLMQLYWPPGLPEVCGYALKSLLGCCKKCVFVLIPIIIENLISTYSESSE